jgi:hypothetical protein
MRTLQLDGDSPSHSMPLKELEWLLDEFDYLMPAHNEPVARQEPFSRSPCRG